MVAPSVITTLKPSDAGMDGPRGPPFRRVILVARGGKVVSR
jgi:hypothetical protein